jgi:hypothetical protein
MHLLGSPPTTVDLGPDNTTIFIDPVGVKGDCTITFRYRGLYRNTKYALRAVGSPAPINFFNPPNAQAVPDSIRNVRWAAFPNDPGVGLAEITMPILATASMWNLRSQRRHPDSLRRLRTPTPQLTRSYRVQTPCLLTPSGSILIEKWTAVEPFRSQESLVHMDSLALSRSGQHGVLMAR